MRIAEQAGKEKLTRPVNRRSVKAVRARPDKQTPNIQDIDLIATLTLHIYDITNSNPPLYYNKHTILSSTSIHLSIKIKCNDFKR